GGCDVQDSVRATHVLLSSEHGTIAAARAELEAMQQKGLLQWAGERLVLLRHRVNVSKDKAKPLPSPARTAHIIEYEQGEKIEINPEESPLAMLYRRRNPNGASFIDESEFLAGER